MAIEVPSIIWPALTHMVAGLDTGHAYSVDSNVYDSFRPEHATRDWTMLTVCEYTGTGSSNNYAYLVKDDKTNDAVIIDPANPPEYA